MAQKANMKRYLKCTPFKNPLELKADGQWPGPREGEMGSYYWMGMGFYFAVMSMFGTG